MVQREPVSTTHPPLHPKAFRFFVPLLLSRLLLRAPRFYQMLALSTTAVSIAIQLLALSTRLLRRLLLRFLPLILQFCLSLDGNVLLAVDGNGIGLIGILLLLLLDEL